MNQSLSLIVGLGNPGRQYAKTRHNLGWQVLDRLSESLRLGFKAGKGEYECAFFQEAGEDIFFLKPTTYMNASGLAVKEALEFFGKSPSRLLVVLDDLALPLGKLRLRARGTSGGHNGLASIIYQLQTDQFARLRLGIGTPETKKLTVDHVLGEFSEAERKTAQEMLEGAAAVVGLCYQKGFQEALNYLSRTFYSQREAAEDISSEK